MKNDKLFNDSIMTEKVEDKRDAEATLNQKLSKYIPNCVFDGRINERPFKPIPIPFIPINSTADNDKFF